MTIKLNASYGKYNANDIVALDAVTEAALIAAGQATATLTGGVPYVDINADDIPANLTTQEIAALRSSVSGDVVPVLSFRDAGGIAVPISSFDGAGISGKFGLAANMLIPANTLTAGQSRIRISVTQRKVGAANNFFQIHLGSANSTGDPAIAASQVSSAGTTPVPSVMLADISISSDGTYCNYVHSRTNVGVTTGEGSVTSGINLAVDNYINFVITGSAAGTTNSLLGYTVDVFR